MSHVNIESLIQNSDLIIRPQEADDERQARIKRENVTFYALLTGCFLMSIVLVCIVYHPPEINGAESAAIQDNAFKALVLFFTGSVSLLVGRKIK